MPLPGAGLSGGCLPREAAGATAPVAGPALEPWIQLRQELRLQGLEAPGGAADLLSWGRSVLAVLGPPGLCLSRGEAGSWAVSRRPVLWSLPCWILTPGRIAASLRSHRPSPSELLPEPRSPLRTEPLPLQEAPPPSCSWCHANRSAQSHHPSPSELVRGQCMCPAALREFGALFWECCVC